MATSLLLRVMCVVLCPALALTGYVAISSCECGCLDVTPFTVCCCDAASRSETAAVAGGRDDCGTEIGQQRPEADAPSSLQLNSQATVIAAADVAVPQLISIDQSLAGAERRSLLAPASAQSPRAPPLA